VGTGTGAIIAVYLGRFGLTIKQCEEAYREVGANVFGRPTSWMGFLSPISTYDHLAFESTFKRQIQQFVPDDLSFCPLCKDIDLFRLHGTTGCHW
jgi:hypothetical protein